MFSHITAGFGPGSFARPRTKVLAVSGLAFALALGGCSATGISAASPSSSGSASSDLADSSSTPFFDDSLVHEVSVHFSDEDYQAMLATYAETGDKDWISATVTIDGTTLENVGLRLKGNSSLRGLAGGGAGGAGGGFPGAQGGEGADEPGAAAEEGVPGTGQAVDEGTVDGAIDDGEGISTTDSPETLPWLIRTDKYVDGQQYQGRTDLVVRGNNTESSLNEAVALELTGAANLATLEASASRFSVNDSEPALRLIIESPDDELWNEDTFGADGSIYKAESGGNYTYRGDNAEDYTDVFEQKAGDDDLVPVMEFLDFVNNSSDEDFSAQLGEHLDVEAFATYLAAQELMGNTDDIDGPGNNSYLQYNADTNKMTVVTWDLNLTFGGMGAGMGGDGDGQAPGGMQAPDGTDLPGGMQRPDGMELPDGMEMPEGMAMPGGAGGPGTMDNPLSSRFLADEGFKALYAEKVAALTADLFDSGAAQQILDKWSQLLTSQAADLIPAETVQSEAENIAAFFTADSPVPS